MSQSGSFSTATDNHSTAQGDEGCVTTLFDGKRKGILHNSISAYGLILNGMPDTWASKMRQDECIFCSKFLELHSLYVTFFKVKGNTFHLPLWPNKTDPLTFNQLFHKLFLKNIFCRCEKYTQNLVVVLAFKMATFANKRRMP